MTTLRLFCRGFVIVALTAANVVFISDRAYLAAFITGFGISAAWWTNAGKAADDRRAVALAAYAIGAATGTVTGMLIAGWLK